MATLTSLRAEAARVSVPVETIAVVNSGDPAEAEAIRPAADRVLVPGRNLGYAGGLNAGLDVARGDVLFLANADLVFLEGSVGELVDAALGGGRVAAGPAFFSDAGATLLHPPAEEPGPREAFRRLLEASDTGRERLFRREARRALRARESVRAGERRLVTSLRGALLCVSRQTLRAAGPFDEGYPLYYEENDWERRLRVLGGRLVQAFGARVVHRFNLSARTEPRAGEWFALSERRFFLSHFGERGRRALEALAAAPPRLSPATPLHDGVLGLPAGRSGETAIALSPLPSLRPFVLALVEAGAPAWAPPPDVLAAIRGSTWWVRAFDPETLAVLGEGTLSPSPSENS